MTAPTPRTTHPVHPVDHPDHPDHSRALVVHRMYQDTGEVPSSNAVIAELGCGRSVANRLLDHLDRYLNHPHDPAGPRLRSVHPDDTVEMPAVIDHEPTGEEVDRALTPRPATRSASVTSTNDEPRPGLRDAVGRWISGRSTGPVPQSGRAVHPGKGGPPVRRGWLVLLALPAFVAVWGGWVGLGGLAGFGPVDLLPGLPGRWTVNLAITLPSGMEVYAVIGLRVWLSSRTRQDRTRRFAAWSTCLALLIGCAGQVAYHVLARPVTGAPMFITVFVACLPVAILGMGAALLHLIGDDDRTEPDATT